MRQTLTAGDDLPRAQNDQQPDLVVRAGSGAEEAVLLQTHDADSFLTFIRRVGVPGGQLRPDPSSLDYAAMNEVAGQAGTPVLGPPMSEEEARAIMARGR